MLFPYNSLTHGYVHGHPNIQLMKCATLHLEYARSLSWCTDCISSWTVDRRWLYSQSNEQESRIEQAFVKLDYLTSNRYKYTRAPPEERKLQGLLHAMTVIDYAI